MKSRRRSLGCWLSGAAPVAGALNGRSPSDEGRTLNEQARLDGGLENGGAKQDRTADLVIANDALSQLSYGPTAAQI